MVTHQAQGQTLHVKTLVFLQRTGTNSLAFFSESYVLVHAALPGELFFGFVVSTRFFTKPRNYLRNLHLLQRTALYKSTYLYIDFSKMV